MLTFVWLRDYATCCIAGQRCCDFVFLIYMRRVYCIISLLLNSINQIRDVQLASELIYMPRDICNYAFKHIIA